MADVGGSFLPCPSEDRSGKSQQLELAFIPVQTQETPKKPPTDNTRVNRATPTTSAISAQLLGLFGQSELSAWVIPCITTAATVTILLFGANSDLFGRRLFLLASCLFGAVGYIVCALAKSTNMLIAGLCLNGVASGMSGIALIAVPELIANKYRHIGVVIADLMVYLFIIIGPIVARFTLLHDDDRWRYLYWAGFIMQAIALIGLFFFYR